MKKLVVWFSMTIVLFSTSAFAEEYTEEQKAYIVYMDSIESTFHFQQGQIPLKSCNITLNVPETLNFIDGNEAERVLTELWGNPPSDEKPIGMLISVNQYLVASNSYAYFIYYSGDGYVKDNDANKIDYDDMLKDLKKSSLEENKLREEQGYPTVELLGWASKPYYDNTTKVLHWAKKYQFSDNDEETLNYDIRVLGRKGILEIKAVANMSSFDDVKKDIPDLLNIAQFDKGYTYADYNSSTDHLAEWTIGSLVAGKVLAKVGFFAAILKFWKVILVALGGIGMFLRKKLKGNKNESESSGSETP